MSCWPTTTRWPWWAWRLAPRYGSRTDAVASLAWRMSGSFSSRPWRTMTKQRVPTLPDADHLEREVDEPVALEEVAPVLGHRRPVVGEDLLERRRAGPPSTCVTTGGSSRITRRPSTTPVSDSKARIPSRRRALLKTASNRARRAAPAATLQQARRLARLPDVGVGDRGVPDVDQAHAGVAGHPLAVAAHGRHRRRRGSAAALKPLARPAITMLAASRLTSHSHGPGSVSSKSFASKTRVRSGRGEQPEVGQVGVAARLDEDVGAGRRGEIERHDRRRAPVVGERGLRHPLVAERDELREPVRLLRLQDRDRVAAGRRLEGGVAGARHPLARGLARPRRAPSGGPTAGRSTLGPWGGSPACQSASYAAAVASSGNGLAPAGLRRGRLGHGRSFLERREWPVGGTPAVAHHP